ncbi:MAG: nucleotide exchange factor GrpE [Flavobacteriales bacterium AspAUS03]
MSTDQNKSSLEAEKEEKYCEINSKKDCKPSEEKSEAEQFAEKLAEEKDRFIRLFAEFENYKKRVQKERLELFKTAHQGLTINLLPILDDFDRGFQEINQSQGMMLIREKFIKILQEKGLKKVDIEKGDDFNTDFHEAITQIPAPAEELKGKIIEVVEAGYLLEDKMIRYAKVVIGK